MRSMWKADQDGWSRTGEKITDPEKLSVIRRTIETRGPVIVEWRHYRGSSAPDRLIFDDYEEFEVWLRGTFAGDDFWVWDYDAVCQNENALTHGKAPDELGEVPRGGAY